jgi:hypothetical protein
MDKHAIAELLKQAELALLAFSTADKHLEQIDVSYLNPGAPSIQMVKLCVQAAGVPLLEVVTGLYEALGIDLASALSSDGSCH